MTSQSPDLTTVRAFENTKAKYRKFLEFLDLNSLF